MQKLHSQYKIIPEEKHFDEFLWYVSFIQVIANIRKMETILEAMGVDYYIWAPNYQEYCKVSFEVTLVDRLLYPGYLMVGLREHADYDRLNFELNSSKLGYMLGDYTCKLKKEEFIYMIGISKGIAEEPTGHFDVKIGDNILISSGPFSGFHGVVKGISKDGQVTMSVYFMNRDVTVIITVTDIQSIGGPLHD